jgi:hypothetical protein
MGYFMVIHIGCLFYITSKKLFWDYEIFDRLWQTASINMLPNVIRSESKISY